MLNENQWILLSISLVIFLISGALFYQGMLPELRKLGSAKSVPTEVISSVGMESTTSGSLGNSSLQVSRVIKVIDGDTIEVEIEGQNAKVRYLGVDTPETVDPRRPVGCFGREASNENKRLLEGKVVYLEKDVSETDKYGRLLRYVYLRLDNGQMLHVNDYLAREGFATISTYPPDVKYSAQFAQAQTQARENNRGLWSACRNS